MAFPQSENLARLMISMLSEQLRSCHFLKKGMETKTKKCVRDSNEWQEVRHSHIIAESVKADGEKGCALYSFKNKELCRQKRADEHGE